MLASTITAKGQTTIPAEIRKALGLETGDKIAFHIKDNKAVISKVEPFDYQYHGTLPATLSEWASSADEEAYHDL